MGERILIDEENVGDYLVSKGIARRKEDVQVERLGGKWGTMGVSSTLLKIGLPDVTYVLKQPMPNLAVKDDWPADPDRIFMEERLIETLGEMLGRDMVPEVVHVDRENYIGMFTYIPPEYVLWKRHLLDGKVDHRIAVKVGEILLVPIIVGLVALVRQLGMPKEYAPWLNGVLSLGGYGLMVLVLKKPEALEPATYGLNALIIFLMNAGFYDRIQPLFRKKS